MTLIDLTGKRFGRLIVDHKAGHRGKDVTWLCKCDCGSVVEVAGASLRSGNTKSCGCYQRERAYQANLKHGGTTRNHKEDLYKRWEGIRKRCYDKGCKSYKDYGGRGIVMGPEWENNYDAFRSWATSNGYKPGLTIERIDVNGMYCPSNCTWIPKCEQSKNRRNTKEKEQ